MASHGNSRHLKRIAASSYQRIDRKVSTYIAKPAPGRHKLGRSVALLVILRDKLGIVANKVEAKKVLKSGGVEVNGKIVRDEKYAIGFGDVVRLVQPNESYSISVAKGAEIKIEKISGKEIARTLKVIGKYLAKGKRVMIRLYDGSALPATKEVMVNDSVVLSGNKVKEVLKLQQGAKCLVMKGAHASETGVVNEIRKGSAASAAMVKIENGGRMFETTLENIMVVGA